MKIISIIIIFLAIIGIFVTGIFLVYQNQNRMEFFESYTIATNYIDSVIQTHKIVEINYGYYNVYTHQEEGYYYDSASTYLDSSLSMLEKTKEKLEKSDYRLKFVQELSPNEFYDKEINLRSEQVNILMEVSIKRIELITLSNEVLYEINFGSQEKADEMTKEINDLIEEMNKDIEGSIEIMKEIDVHWSEDWYPN